MIRELDRKDELKIILDCFDKSPSLMRIKALLKAYGLGRSFIHFFSNEDGKILICTENNHSILHLKNESYIAEASEFLNVTTNSVIGEYRLSLCGFKEKSGNIYSFKGEVKKPPIDVDFSLQSGFDVLKRVFPEEINDRSYNSWYADLSHRVRHNMSKIYTIKEKASVTAYCCENGRVMITQARHGSRKQKRGLGALAA